MMKSFRDVYSSLSPERKARIDARARELRAQMPLAELRTAMEKSQAELAAEMGAQQSQVSRLEKQADAYVSTLRRYIESLGGQLVITATFPTGSIEITQFGETAEIVKAKPATDLRFKRIEDDPNVTILPKTKDGRQPIILHRLAASADPNVEKLAKKRPKRSAQPRKLNSRQASAQAK